MIDSHCHLADKKFDTDLEAVIHRAAAAGIDRMITIGDTMEESEKCLAIAQKHEQIFCTIGVHPHCAKQWKKEERKRIASLLASSSKAVAVGEIGLDYHYMRSPADVQKDVFRQQLLTAKELGKPAVVHCRDAIKDVKAIIAEVKPPKVVIHCCTEQWEDAEPLVKKGHFLSFTGIATFPASGDIRRTIKLCPTDQLMIETDSPYLAPAPHRGKRNEPAFVFEVARCVAWEKGVSLEEIDRITTENTIRFFGLPD